MPSGSEDKRFKLGLGLSSSKKLPFQKPAKNTTNVAKGRAFGFDDDDDKDEHERQDELVVEFSENKAIELNPKQDQKPYIIHPPPSFESRRRQIYMPAQARAQAQAQSNDGQAEQAEVLDKGSKVFGLYVPPKRDETTSSLPTEPVEEQPSKKAPEEPVKELSLEEQAAQAIVKDLSNEDNENKHLIIKKDETEAFQQDVQDRPDEPTMEDYEKIPVEEFGAALLRGLGWTDGESIGRNRKNTPVPTITPIKQRDALLGLGAQPYKTSEGKKLDRRSQYVYKLEKRPRQRSPTRHRSRSPPRSSSSSSSRHRSPTRRRSRSPSRPSSSPSSSSSRHRRDHDRFSSSSRRR